MLSPCCLHEKLTRRDLSGTLVVVSGCVFAGVSAPHSATTYTLDALLGLYTAPAFIAYAVAVGSVLAGACIGRRATAPPAVRRLCASALPGVIVGNTNILAKSFSELLAQSRHAQSPLARIHPPPPKAHVPCSGGRPNVPERRALAACMPQRGGGALLPAHSRRSRRL